MRRTRRPAGEAPIASWTRLCLALGVALFIMAGITVPAQAAALYTASINPTTVRTSQTITYTLVITNHPTSTVHLGSANVTVYGSFTAVSLGSLATPSGKPWTADFVSGIIELRAADHTYELAPGESVSIAATATAPNVPGPSFWTTEARNNPDFSGSPFTLSGSSPTVEVILNHPPTATVSLSPTNPSTAETLVANASGADADGDTVALSFAWKVNGIVRPGQTGTSLDLSVPGNGDPGDMVSVEVTPNDGFVNGTVTTARATVVNLYTVSGFVRTSRALPIPGVSVTFTGQLEPSVTNSSGYYVFNGVKAGQYTLTPAKTGYTFAPPAVSIVVSTASRLVNFVGTPTIPLFNISGRVSTPSGLPIPNVSLAISPAPAGVSTPVLTNSAGYFTFYDLPNGSYTITPTKPGISFTPSSRTVTLSGVPVAGQNFIGTPVVPVFSISGRVSTPTGAPIADVSVAISPLAPNVTTPVLTNSAGYYTFTQVPDGGIHTITPARPGMYFTPSSRTVTVSGASVTRQNFVGSTAYTASGRVSTSSGASVPGVTVQLDNGPTSITNSAGYFTFYGVANGSHTLTPGRAGMTFLPPTRTVNVSGASVSGQNFIVSGP